LKNFLGRKIDASIFNNVLREHDINPNIEEIRKYIRSHEAGIHVKYNDLLYSIKRFAKNGTDPAIEDKKRLLSPKSKDLREIQKGKRLNPSHNSNKDLFDWEEQEHKEIMKKINKASQPPSNKIKFTYESTVFKLDTEPCEFKPALRSVKSSASTAVGDFITW
jgi:hypothetical protein